MTIKHNEYPPNFDEISKTFSCNFEEKNTVFTYGHELYNPTGKAITDHLYIHEQVHEQQQTNPKKWWKVYLKNAEFRLAQELQAFRAQYAYAKPWIKDRNQLARFLSSLASNLSSDTYGNCISYAHALEEIRK